MSCMAQFSPTYELSKYLNKIMLKVAQKSTEKFLDRSVRKLAIKVFCLSVKTSQNHQSIDKMLTNIKLNMHFLAWAWLAKPKAIVIVYQLFRPCHAFTKKKKNRGKVRTTACKIYQCASKKPRGNKNIFSVEHDS